MALWLYRIGKGSFHRPFAVLAGWLAALLLIGGVGFAFAGQTEEEFRIPGSESQEAYDRLESVFPVFAGASVQVVLQSTDGERLDTPQNKRLIEQLTADIEERDGIETAISPFDEFAGKALSDDGRVGFIQVQYTLPAPEVSDEMLADLLAARDVIDGSPISIEFGGSVFQDTEVGLTIAEVFGLVFAGLVLVITFRSLRPSWMPLASALVGVGVTLGGIFLAANLQTISSSAPLLAVMLGLAVGIDYSLFILSRHRNQLAEGVDPEESAGIAVGTAGNAVVFAGITVIIALLGLFLVGIPFLSVMGAAASVAVGVAIIAAITLLPALMGLLGHTLTPRPGSQAMKIAELDADTPSLGRRWVRIVTAKPLLTTVVTVATLAVMALPAASLSLALPGGGQEPVDSTQRKAYDILSEGFGAGYNGPLIVTMDVTSSNELLDRLDEFRSDLEDIPGVDWVGEGFPSPTLDTVIYQVIPDSAPDSPETADLVKRIRAEAGVFEDRYEAKMAITGITAIGVDVSSRISEALIPFGLVVVGLSIALLLAVFRSVLVPLKAAAGFILSVVAAFGVVVAVFQWGWFADLLHVESTGPILSFMPIILMAVLFGLAMDYEVFLVSGMREEYVRTGDWRYAIEEGYSRGARVVTAAALIMFFVFASFVPEGSNLIKPIALGLAVGIFVDAFVVRMTLVPAVMALAKKAGWSFPKPLDRVVPHADVEGETLRDHLEQVRWVNDGGKAVVRADYLVLAEAPSVTPLSMELREGDRVDLVGDPATLRIAQATLAGYRAPSSGYLQVLGHPLPSEAAWARSHVSVWNRDNDDALTPLGAALLSRLRWSNDTYRLGRNSHNALVRETIEKLNRLIQLSGNGDTLRITRDTLPGLLPGPYQLAAWAALTLIGRSPLTIIQAHEPVTDLDTHRRWWEAISLFAEPHQTVVLCSLPPLRALNSEAEGRVGIDLGQPVREEATR